MTYLARPMAIHLGPQRAHQQSAGGVDGRMKALDGKLEQMEGGNKVKRENMRKPSSVFTNWKIKELKFDVFPVPATMYSQEWWV